MVQTTRIGAISYLTNSLDGRIKGEYIACTVCIREAFWELNEAVGSLKCLYGGSGFPQTRTGERAAKRPLCSGTGKLLMEKCLGGIGFSGLVLARWFTFKNVPWVPSRLGLHFLSNGTGKRGVDPKDRVAHLSRD